RDLHVAAAEALAATTPDALFSISGRGSGHGIGMSQWGARGLAAEGSAYKDILRHYYTGIGFGEIGSPTVRVLLQSGLSTVKLTCPEAFTVRGSADAVTIPAGTTATTTYVDGKYRVVAGGWSRDFGAPVTFAPTANRLTVLTTTDAGVTGPHRGTIRVVASGGSLLMVNDVGMQSYLRGVVAYEMPASWPAEALKAQACAARSYAERARLQGTGEFDLYCDARSQFYGGMAREDERTDAAVVATVGVVPTVGDDPIHAFYFSCSGGQTENIELAWKTSPLSYLKGVDDPFDDAAPLHTWGPLSRTAAEMEASLGTAVQGSLVAVCPVEWGVSPRIVKAAIVGTEGTTYLHGSTLRSMLSLSSAWATFTSMSIAPAGADGVTIAAGDGVTLEGRVYPGLPADAVVTLYSEVDGVWRGRDVTTTQQTQALPDGYDTAYSAYSVTVSPSATTRYYFGFGDAVSPTTTVTVRG
ncbi:MAG: SpoIID/LytB domain-containing protein, partial [Thermoleophilia bacterium]|nr:SpoIID/LytB domain-containing protein [Thermoleophilia bacterium]